MKLKLLSLCSFFSFFYLNAMMLEDYRTGSQQQMDVARKKNSLSNNKVKTPSCNDVNVAS